MMDDDEVDPLRTPLLDRTEEDAEVAASVVEEETAESSNVDDPDSEATTANTCTTFWQRALHAQLFPDQELVFRGNLPILEGTVSVKLLKFLALTFGSIFLLHWIITTFRGTAHRDATLTARELWKFDTGLIVSDTVVFFVVGRLWQPHQRGVDHLAWVGMILLSNVYFESQHYIPFLRHSFTLYEMHCVWPWQLWIFVGCTIPLLLTLVIAHIVHAYRTRRLWRKLTEVLVCGTFFVAPVLPSPYFHFHHWFAGWLLGMHCNLTDVWWSKAVMAWCWGMYINGIAVYGRDPVLTCEYAYFVSTDQNCPFLNDDCQATSTFTTTTFTTFTSMEPAADWRNCSAHGYHP
jgi:hypothetical protein